MARELTSPQFRGCDQPLPESPVTYIELTCQELSRLEEKGFGYFEVMELCQTALQHGHFECRKLRWQK